MLRIRCHRRIFLGCVLEVAHRAAGIPKPEVRSGHVVDAVTNDRWARGRGGEPPLQDRDMEAECLCALCVLSGIICIYSQGCRVGGAA